MSRPTSKPLASWLGASSEQLDALLSHVRLLRRLTAALRDGLPDAVAAECQAANLDGTSLVIAASSPAWAAKLRYHLPTVLARLQARNDLPPVTSLRIRTQAPRLERDPVPARRANLSAETAALIGHVADNTTDPALRAALQRLARHASKKAT